jgi:DNA-binding NtrC family response regulator
MNTNILIIDDNKKFSSSLANNFRRIGYSVTEAENSRIAESILRKQEIEIILLDIMLGKESGIDLFKKLKQINENITIIIITGYATIEAAVEAIKIGAYNYIQKPIKFNKLLKIVENALESYSLKRENKQLKERLLEYSHKMITQNKKMSSILVTIKKLASANLPILLLGENGTGKEVFADYIHLNSNRHIKKMVKINCAAFPESLLDNELFGHEKGAYTGADSVFKGVFEKADKGTLFLDEIGDMSPNIQAKILRVLQNNEIRRLGGNDVINVDVHFIASTNKNIEEMVRKNIFRMDLYYRLNTATVKIPSLKERKDDIPILVKYFIDEYSKLNNKAVTDISDSVLDIFLDYSWPGNVRELKNTIFYACAVTSKNIIGIDDLPVTLLPFNSKMEKNNIFSENEKIILFKTLKQFNNNKKKVAEILQISRSTLYSKLKRYGLPISK